MKLKGKFVNEVIGDDTFMVSMDNSVLQGFIRSNQTATFIINCLKEDASEETIVRQMAKKYNISETQAKSSVQSIITELRENNLLDE
ncbi:MAG: PqqD family protein [Oribacterium sp.]|nr:PqqD family protein [Oribacterium sp.]